MKALNKKGFLSGMAILMLLCLNGFAQKAALTAVAGVKGNWVICGDALPKQFSYKIWRQEGTGAWQAAGQLHMPASRQEIKASLYNIEKTAGIDVLIDDDQVQNVWQRVNDAVAKNSPPEIQDDLPYRYATGTAWYDATAQKGVTYRYKVQMIGGKNVGEELVSNLVKYPAEKFQADIRPVSVKPILTGISVEFEVVNKGKMTHCKVLRSYYLRTGFEEINPEPIFVGREGSTFIQFTDNTAVPKVPYNYVIVPLDGAGNEGTPSAQAKVFNVADNTIAPSVYGFRTYSEEANKAIRLGWKLDDTRDVVSIDIYKSATYDGNYVKIAGVPPTDTSYTDVVVQPITQYFYAIKLNGRYESSPASPRIPGILKASEPNPMPPMNVEMKQNGDKVTLTWKRSKLHTHAYFIYRAGSDGKPKQIGPPLITDSLNLSFTDVLPASETPQVYIYRIVDENTSYVISPLSQPMYAYTNGAASLPIPYSVSTRRVNDGKVMVIWPDLRKQFTNFIGYKLYRRTEGGTAEPVGTRLIPKNVNMYTDSAFNAPGVYYYSLRTVAEDGKTLSSPSLEAGFTVNASLPAQVTNITVLPVNTGVLVSWNNAVGQAIKATQVYRAEEGKAAELIATLPAGAQTYTDSKVKAGIIYYYTLISKNNKDEESPATDPVGVHVR